MRYSADDPGTRLWLVQKESRHGSGSEADRERPHEELHEDARSEEEQRLQTQLYQSLLNSLDIGVANTSRDGQILYANRRFAEILGLREFDNPVGSYLKEFVSSRDWGSLSEALRHGSVGAAEGEITFVETETSDVKTVRCSFSRLSDSESIKLIATEVTELVETTKALKESEASLQNLSARLLQVQDNERRRMARDLHDVTGQELAVAIMAIDRMTHNAAHDQELQTSLAETAGQLRRVEADIRTLSYVLHPPLLDEMGLRSALQWYTEGFSKRTGIELDVKIPENVPRFGIEQETALFRVIQEALTNVFRHSGSRRARVRISLRAGILEARVEDEGKGVRRDQSEAGLKPGVGIQSMKDRLKTLGGNLDLRSGPQGTQIIASLPLLSRSDSDMSQPSPETEPLREGHPASVSVMEPVRKRILIADDHEIARRGIRALLGGQPDLEICGEAADGLEAVTKTQQLKPDLLILDLSMPHLGGFSAVNQIRRSGLSTKILMYTTHSYPGLERVARAAGCDGFVLKSNASQDLIRGARIVLQGGQFYGSEIAQANSA